MATYFEFANAQRLAIFKVRHDLTAHFATRATSENQRNTANTILFDLAALDSNWAELLSHEYLDRADLDHRVKDNRAQLAVLRAKADRLITC